MKCSLWIHDYEIFYEFIRWIQTQIYDHEDSLKKIVKLYVRIHMYEIV